MISAPSSTRNTERKRESEMHLTKREYQWYIRIKFNIGLNRESGMIHSVLTRAITPTANDLNGDEDVAWGNPGSRYGNSNGYGGVFRLRALWT